MSRFGGKDTYLEFTGTIESRTSKAILFQGDYWDAGEWLPLSQVIVENDGDAEGNRAVVKIKEWLCKKNGWEEE